jgi:hypothetical protein
MADKTGSCFCGAVACEITGQLRPVIACHCPSMSQADRHLYVVDRGEG